MFDRPLIFSPIGESAARPIVRFYAGDEVCKRALSPPVMLLDADKLDALRRLDRFRQWRSLDEKRYCLVCGKIITGRQIKVAGETRGNESLRIKCPTKRCNSIPMDWVTPTNEINKNAIVARLRRFATFQIGFTSCPTFAGLNRGRAVSLSSTR